MTGVIVTGDVVNEGKTEHIGHAEDIFHCLCDGLAISKNKLFGCHGNHDFERTLVTDGKYAEAIDPITGLFEKFGNKRDARLNPLAELQKITDGVFLLLLDSIYNTPKDCPGAPGKPPGGQMDMVADAVCKNLQPEDILIIATHHPLTDFHMNTAEEKMQERLWQAGRDLANRIEDIRLNATGATIWLSGDIHIPFKPHAFGDKNGITCLLGYHFDNNTAKSSQQSVGAVLIHVFAGSKSGESFGVEFEQHSHSVKNCIDAIHFTQSFPFPNNPSTLPVPETKLDSQAGEAAHEPSLNSESFTSASVTDSLFPVELFPDTPNMVSAPVAGIEEQIIQTITTQKLYHFGRFQTSDRQVSLGWVSMGPLLAGRYTGSSRENPIVPLLPQVVPRMRAWIERIVEKLNLPSGETDVLLYGVDCWGAAIASQISISTGWKNFCLAGRGGAAHHTTHEGVTKGVVRDTKSAVLGVFVVDVISSGHTLRRLYNEINKRIEEDKSHPDPHESSRKWIAAAVLCDMQTDRRETLEFLAAIGCACRSLRMPIISTEFLPPVAILPTDLCFITDPDE